MSFEFSTEPHDSSHPVFDEVLLDMQSPSQESLQSLLKAVTEKMAYQNGCSSEPALGRYYLANSDTELTIERTGVDETPFVVAIKEWVGEHQGIIKTEYYMFEDDCGELSIDKQMLMDGAELTPITPQINCSPKERQARTQAYNDELVCRKNVAQLDFELLLDFVSEQEARALYALIVVLTPYQKH